MKKNKPAKTRILQTLIVLNDGTHIWEYEAQIRYE